MQSFLSPGSIENYKWFLPHLPALPLAACWMVMVWEQEDSIKADIATTKSDFIRRDITNGFSC